jgi:diadenosine tetraphosphate (Ap4A) HIT family hydrolase/shikimate kinase
MADWRDDRIGSAHRGENPMVMARMRSGFAVIGDTQHLPGYALLLCEDAAVDQLTDLALSARVEFLTDLALLGESVAAACSRLDGFRRINYEVLGNSLDWLHGHVHARWDWEPAEYIGGPVWLYPERFAEEHAYEADRHGPLRAGITAELERLMAATYGGRMRVLLTGMSGVGKSALVAELRRRGESAYDADDHGFSELREDGRWGWRVDRVADLLDTDGVVFFAGCSDEQAELRFDYRVLLTAPREVIVQRLRTRTSNPYGREGAELAQVLADLDEVEPRLRRSADLVLTTTAPVAEVVDVLLERINARSA